MIHSLLVKTLRGTGQFKEVVAAPQVGPHKYALRSELLELQQDFTAATPTLRLTMRIQVVDGATWLYTTGEVSGRLPFMGWMPVLAWQREPEVVRREGAQLRLFGFQD